MALEIFAPRTLVLFRSDAFNTSQERDYFINPCCFGDDVAHWFIEELRSRNIIADAEPSQEDWGWYFDFSCEGISYTLNVGLRPEDDGDNWLCWIEPPPNSLWSRMRGQKNLVHQCAALGIHEVLVQSDKVRDVRWFHKKQCDESEPAAHPLD